MHLPAANAEYDIPTLRQFIRDNPLGIFTTAIPSPAHPLLQSSHIPWILDVHDESSPTELGTLRGHMARANPQAKALVARGTRALQEEFMVLFNGPAHHYVTPKWYTETKPATGRTVPTWDYAAVEVYGRATIYFDAADPETGAFLSKAVEDLSQHAETHLMRYERPWKVGDAPSQYVELLKKAIIGMEVEITSMAGRFKMSQDKGKGDREGVVEGFEALGTETGLRMAEAVREQGELADERKKKALA
ncbi:hypothetical protein PLICRDRAFT_35805 [Plicaturopsis crispa FD-325 SS-3]|nr:hypothetical protein PLICRDRAFT_35805 [Plicaturopsis crispa FD-325 SS-3]